MEKREFGRRDFLKMAGLGTALGAGALAANSALPKVAKAEYNKPVSPVVNMAIKYLDTPSYNLPPYADADKLKRFNQGKVAFMNPKFMEEYTGGELWTMYAQKQLVGRFLSKDPDLTIRDFALTMGATTSWDLPIFHDWGVNYDRTFTKLVGKWEDTPERNSQMIKKAAHFYGAGATGICMLNQQWVYDIAQETPNPGNPLPDPTAYKQIFDDTIDTLEVTKEYRKIPTSMKYAIVCLIPMEGNLYKFVPSKISNAPIFRAYSQLSELVSKLAGFIRALGYQAIPAATDTALSVPMAIEAGLGELGRNGILINPEYGPCCRICKVITDLPLKPDKPISFGVARFCMTCKKCAELCPSKSISMETEPSYDTYGEWNNAGMKKWYVNGMTCLNYWVQGGIDCGVCQRVCTYSKPGTWVHDMIKLTTSKTGIFNSVFAKMDDAFGYGKVWDDYTMADIEDWWYNDSDRNLDWQREYSR